MAVVLALVPAAALTARRVLDSPAAAPADHSTDLPIPPVSPSATPSTVASTTTSSPSPSPSPSPTARPLPRVAPDAPRRLVSGDQLDTGFDSAVTSIDASSASEVARWETRGSPGSPGTDTVFVVGRTYADGASAFANLPRIKPGARIQVRTDSGTLTYTVRSAGLRAEQGLARSALFTARRPGRLVLVGIRYDASGDRLSRALVVTAQLTGATRS